MGIKLAPREKVLVFITLLALVFLAYWYGLLRPMLGEIAREKADIAGAQKQLTQLTTGMSSAALLKLEQKKLDVYSREKQLYYLLNHINANFRKYHISLTALKQSSDSNIITIDINIKSTYYALLSFLNSLSQLNTLLVIESAGLTQRGEEIETQMRILSGYQ